MLSKFKNYFRNVDAAGTNPWVRSSYSQCGEDMIIDYVFKLRGILMPSYLDIGANHPFFLSNTAFFYAKGCRGINVEANPNLISAFELHRPEDININVGIGDIESEMDFYVMEDNTLSTFSKHECEKMMLSNKPLLKTERVQIRTLDYILDKYNKGTFPDFLSLDAEGMDYLILKTLDYGEKCPKVICVESAEYSPNGTGSRRSELVDFLLDKDYYEYANTNLNSIMVKKEFWFI